MDEELKIGIQLFEAKKFDEARKYFETMAVTDQPIAAQVSFYLARLYLIQKDFERAINSLERAIQFDANNSEYHLWLGKAYALKVQKVNSLKKLAAARCLERELQKAVELDTANTAARMGLVQFYLQAPAIAGGNKDKAQIQADEIRQINSTQGHLAQSLIYRFDKENELAEQEYLAAIKENPRTFEAYYQLAYLYTENNNFDKALELMEILDRDYPQESNAYFMIGRIAAMAGTNLERGTECLKIYLTSPLEEDSPSKALANYMLGLIYKQKGNQDLAREQFELALKLEPELKEARQSLEELTTM